MPMLAGTGKSSAVPTAHVCKVLITGDSKANISSIKRALQQCEMPGEVTMQIAEQALNAKELSHIDKYFTIKLSQFNAIIIAVDASGIRLPITGGGGRSTPLMEKFEFYGIHPLSIYFVATGDRSAGTITGQEYVSESILKRVGPMQLGVLEDYISHARFLSWLDAPMHHQQSLLREHMFQLAKNKPKQNVDTTNFRCAFCGKDIPIQDLRDMLAEGQNVSTSRPVCTSCSNGFCLNCGLQISPGTTLDGKPTWAGVTHCNSCNAALEPPDLVEVLRMPPPRPKHRNKYTQKERIEWKGVVGRAYT